MTRMHKVSEILTHEEMMTAISMVLAAPDDALQLIQTMLIEPNLDRICDQMGETTPPEVLAAVVHTLIEMWIRAKQEELLAGDGPAMEA